MTGEISRRLAVYFFFPKTTTQRTVTRHMHTHTLTHACVHTTGGGLLACGICYACIQDGAVNNNNNNININDNNNERISPVVVEQQCKTQRSETCAEVRDERGNIKRSFR